MANKTATKRLKITRGSIQTGEGALYEVYVEDGIAHVFDCWVAVEAGGKTWMQPHAVKGSVEHDGYRFPNRNYRRQLDALVSWIESVGSINPAKWQQVNPDWAERAREADALENLREHEAQLLGRC